MQFLQQTGIQKLEEGLEGNVPSELPGRAIALVRLQQLTMRAFDIQNFLENFNNLSV